MTELRDEKPGANVTMDTQVVMDTSSQLNQRDIVENISVLEFEEQDEVTNITCVISDSVCAIDGMATSSGTSKPDVIASSDDLESSQESLEFGRVLGEVVHRSGGTTQQQKPRSNVIMKTLEENVVVIQPVTETSGESPEYCGFITSVTQNCGYIQPEDNDEETASVCIKNRGNSLDQKIVKQEESTVDIDTGSISERTVIDNENVVIDNENVVIVNESVVISKESVVIDNESVVKDKESMVIDNANVVIDKENVVIDNANVVIDKERALPDKAPVTSNLPESVFPPSRCSSTTASIELSDDDNPVVTHLYSSNPMVTSTNKGSTTESLYTTDDNLDTSHTVMLDFTNDSISLDDTSTKENTVKIDGPKTMDSSLDDTSTNGNAVIVDRTDVVNSSPVNDNKDLTGHGCQLRSKTGSDPSSPDSSQVVTISPMKNEVGSDNHMSSFRTAKEDIMSSSDMVEGGDMSLSKSEVVGEISATESSRVVKKPQDVLDVNVVTTRDAGPSSTRSTEGGTRDAVPSSTRSTEGGTRDAGPSSTRSTEGGTRDAVPSSTRSTEGGTRDAVPSSTRSTEGGTRDAGPSSTRSTEGGTRDAVPSSTRSTEGGTRDAGPSSTRSTEGGTRDAVPSSTRSTEGGTRDTGPSSTRSTEGGTRDAGPSSTRSTEGGTRDTGPSSTRSTEGGTRYAGPSSTRSPEHGDGIDTDMCSPVKIEDTTTPPPTKRRRGRPPAKCRKMVESPVTPKSKEKIPPDKSSPEKSSPDKSPRSGLPRRESSRKPVPKKLDPDFVGAKISRRSLEKKVDVELVGNSPLSKKLKENQNPAPTCMSRGTKRKLSEMTPASSPEEPRPRSPRVIHTKPTSPGKKSPPKGELSPRKRARKALTGAVVETKVTVDRRKSVARPHTKPCTKNNCSVRAPVCFARVSNRCCKNKWTSRWYHVSTGEHYCNDCFEYFYRTKKDGYKEFVRWKKRWTANGKLEPSLKVFLVDQILPYWTQCTVCSQWRELPRSVELDPQLAHVFVCGINLQTRKIEDKQACKLPEDKRVNAAKDPYWINHLTTAPFMKDHPATPFLVNFYPDLAGLSAFYAPRNTRRKKYWNQHGNCSDTDLSSSDDEDKSLLKSEEEEGEEIVTPHVPGCPPFLQPFLQPEHVVQAQAFHPSVQDLEEESHFPEYSTAPHMYITLRNLVLALWCLHPKKVLTVVDCIPHMICRGLVRVRCVEELQRIINYLTLRGLVNVGVPVGVPTQGLLPREYNQRSVLVIGAGIAGISAARQLANFGSKVTVLEAQNRLGGRIYDDYSRGVCIGRGGQILNGTVNNPISVVCHQDGIAMVAISDECDVIDDTGKLVNPNSDRRINFHFNAMLDNVAEWRKGKDRSHDTHLLDKIEEMHKQFIEESQLNFTQQEDQLIRFHIANIEYACGCALTDLSAMFWDQNEDYPQFTGGHMLLEDGYSRVVDKLAEGLDVRLNMEVESVNFETTPVTVQVKKSTSTSDREEFHADCVLVTVPITVLKRNGIEFIPPLPKSKRTAIEAIGTGQVEKVVMEFPSSFWSQKVGGSEYFGHVSTDPNAAEIFSIFCDITTKLSNKHILVSYISGSAVDLIQGLTDKQVIDKCVQTLQKMFPEQTVPKPVHFSVTKWSQDRHTGMAYSYLPVGISGPVYDEMATTVNSRVYFAGEATCRQFPQSVSGACMSGIREAQKICEESYQKQGT